MGYSKEVGTPQHRASLSLLCMLTQGELHIVIVHSVIALICEHTFVLFSKWGVDQTEFDQEPNIPNVIFVHNHTNF